MANETETKAAPIEKAPVIQNNVPSGGTETVSLPVVKPETIQKGVIPDSIKNTTFTDVDSFEVEQLPEHTKPGEKGGIKTTDEVTDPKKVESTETTEEVPIEDGVKPADKIDETKLDDTKPKTPKWLKPPTDANKAAESDGKKPAIKTIVPPVGKVTRDYSGYTAEQVSAFKKMSDEGYALTTGLIKENRELGKLRETTFMQHEQGYVLDPGFQSIRANVIQASREEQYLKSQLALIKDGKPWKPITGVDKRTGAFVYAAEEQPTAAAEEDVRQMMLNANRVANELNGQLQTYPQRYKQQVSQDLQEIEQIRKQQFGWVSNPDLLNYTIECEGVGEIPLKRIKDDMINTFPAYMRGHPAVGIVGDLMIALRLSQAELSEARSTQQVDSTIQEEKSRVEPKSTQKPKNLNGASVHGIKEFKDDTATL